MSRVFGVVIVAAMCAGCRNPTPVYDPFLGRTTVPPPGTVAPPPGQPYYAAPPAGATTAPPPLMSPQPTGASAVPPRAIGPTNFAPASAGGGGLSSAFTPNVSPQPTGGVQTPGVLPVSAATPLNATPGAAPSPTTATPTMVRPVYGLPGGGPPPAMLPTTAVPPAASPTLAQAPVQGVPTLANPSTAPGAVGVKPASWESSAATSALNSATPVVFNSTPDKNAIRIVAPPAGSTPPVVTPVSTASPGTLNQSLASTRVPEITDLPPVSSAARTSAAATAPTGTKPVSGDPAYGYDPQYRWLKGRLEYSQSTRSWRLRYIPPDGNTDSYGGSVVLADNSQLTGLQPGDSVYAQGMLGAASASQGSFAPQYTLQRIQKL